MDVDTLDKILRAHGAPADRAALRAAIDDPERGGAFAAWAATHLGDDTLLTKDELSLYAALDNLGRVDRLVASRDLASVQGLSEREVVVSIEELGRSTREIERQTETLRMQRDALARLVRASERNEEARAKMELKRGSARDAERKRVASAVEDLSQSVEFKVADLEQQLKAAASGLHETVDGLLRSDDRLLSSLQKLGWELETEDPEEEEAVARLREICMRLIKSTVESVRTRLDRVYLESLQASQKSGRGSPVPADEISALQEELDSLYLEILPVAQMSIEQQYLEPALKSLSGKNSQILGRSSSAVSYIHSCLDYLIDHVDRLSERIEVFQAHRAATGAIASTAKSELAIPATSPVKSTKTPSTPTRRRKSSGHTSPTRARSNTTGSLLRRRSSSTAADDPPLDVLLRSLALSLPPVSDGPPITSHDQLTTLTSALADRREKADEVARSAQETFEHAAAAQLTDARRAVQLLQDSMLAESSFGEVRLVDPEIASSIEVLGQEVERMKGRVEAVDSSAAKARSEKKAELLNRWG